MNQETTSTPRPGPLFFALVGLAVAGLATLLTLPTLDTATRQLADTDGYMRFVRIADLRAGAVGWFESFEGRSNTPFGHSMHWTRPQDVVVIGVSLLLQPFVGVGDALYLAAVASGPLLFGVLGGVVAWAAFPLVGRVGAVVAGLGVVLQPGLAAYGAAGRVDHHALIFVVAGLLLGVAVRLGLTPSRGLAMAAGWLAALGVWVSTEFLLPVGLALVAGAVAWVRHGSVAARILRTAAGSWLVGSVGCLFVERGAGELAAAELDRLSWVHVFVAGVVAACWWAADRWSEGRPSDRLMRGVVIAVAALAAVVMVVPQFLSGPFGDVPKELWDGWLGGVAELQPLWPLGDGFERALYLLAAPVLGIGQAILAARSRASAVWWGIAAVLVVTSALAVFQLRFSTYPQLVATLPWAWLAATLVDKVGARRDVVGSLARVGAMGLGVAGFLVPVLAVGLVSDRQASSGASQCGVDTMVEIVERAAGPAVLAHVDFGPELLYRTDARVVAAPYHRNVAGILDGRRFFLRGADEARQMASTRSLDLVFVCPTRDRGYLGAAADDPESMYTMLVEGSPPAWLVEIPTSDDLLAFTVDLGG
jgi:hypothetical protein